MYWKTFPHRSTPVINQILLNICKKKNKYLYLQHQDFQSSCNIYAHFPRIFKFEFTLLSDFFFYYHSSDNLQRQEHTRQSILILYIVYWKIPLYLSISAYKREEKTTSSDKVTFKKEGTNEINMSCKRQQVYNPF